MNKIKSNEWMTIPILPCVDIEDTLAFWTNLGFETTYKQTRPYQYGVVARGGYALHFARLKGLEAKKNIYTGCLVVVTSAESVYAEFCATFKRTINSVPHAGIPRISRMKPNTTRFTLTDVAGNSVIFVSYGEQDQQEWEKSERQHQSRLKKALAVALRFRDYKNDDLAAARTLDGVLKQTSKESPRDIAEALVIRLELANAMNETDLACEIEKQITDLQIADDVLEQLHFKHRPGG